MNELKFRKLNKMASCTENPLIPFIPFEQRFTVLLKIKQESLDLYGVDLSSECPNISSCNKKTCLGRPLPYKSPTAKPYIDKLAKIHNVKNKKLYIETDCSKCPIINTCSSTCNQINDYIQKDKIKEPIISYRPTLDNLEIEAEEEIEPDSIKFKDIPWDCLSETRKKVVHLYIYEKRDFQHISKLLNLNNQARVKMEFYYALTTLSEYGIMREFIKDNGHELTDREQEILTSYYIDNLDLSKIGNNLSISKQAVQQTIKRVIKKYNIKWKVFVKKQGTKVIYSVPEIMK